MPDQRVIFDTFFTRLLIACRTGEEEHMDILLVGLAIVFFLASAWFITALDRL